MKWPYAAVRESVTKIVGNCFPFIVVFILLTLAQIHLNINNLLKLIAFRVEMFVCTFLWITAHSTWYFFFLLVREMKMIWQQNGSVSYNFRWKLFVFLLDGAPIIKMTNHCIETEWPTKTFQMVDIECHHLKSKLWKWKISFYTSMIWLFAISCCCLFDIFAIILAKILLASFTHRKMITKSKQFCKMAEKLN